MLPQVDRSSSPSGKVGINQPSPQRKLHVKSGANNSDGAFRIESATSNIMDMGTDGTGHFINCVNTDPFSIKFAGTREISYRFYRSSYTL